MNHSRKKNENEFMSIFQSSNSKKTNLFNLIEMVSNNDSESKKEKASSKSVEETHSEKEKNDTKDTTFNLIQNIIKDDSLYGSDSNSDNDKEYLYKTKSESNSDSSLIQSSDSEVYKLDGNIVSIPISDDDELNSINDDAPDSHDQDKSESTNDDESESNNDDESESTNDDALDSHDQDKSESNNDDESNSIYDDELNSIYDDESDSSNVDETIIMKGNQNIDSYFHNSIFKNILMEVFDNDHSTESHSSNNPEIFLKENDMNVSNLLSETVFNQKDTNSETESSIMINQKISNNETDKSNINTSQKFVSDEPKETESNNFPREKKNKDLRSISMSSIKNLIFSSDESYMENAKLEKSENQAEEKPKSEKMPKASFNHSDSDMNLEKILEKNLQMTKEKIIHSKSQPNLASSSKDINEKLYNNKSNRKSKSKANFLEKNSPLPKKKESPISHKKKILEIKSKLKKNKNKLNFNYHNEFNKELYLKRKESYQKIPISRINQKDFQLQKIQLTWDSIPPVDFKISNKNESHPPSLYDEANEKSPTISLIKTIDDIGMKWAIFLVNELSQSEANFININIKTSKPTSDISEDSFNLIQFHPTYEMSPKIIKVVSNKLKIGSTDLGLISGFAIS